MKQLEDIYKTSEFKMLPWYKRVYIRIQVAIINTLTMM